MNKIQEEIDQAFGLISNIAVSGPAVDVMFSAKQHLRQASDLVSALNEKKDSAGPGKTGEGGPTK